MNDKITGFQFDATNVAPSQSFDLLPKGWYQMQATDAEIKPTRDGTGQYIALTVDVLGPQFAANRKLWSNFNTVNSNAQAVEIGMADLSALMHAIGVLRIQDLTELLMKPFLGKVKIRKASKGYDDSNEIEGYKPINEPVKLAEAPIATASAGAAVTPPPGFGGPAQPFSAPTAQPAPQFAQPQQAPAPQFAQPVQPQQATQQAPQQVAQPQFAAPQQQPMAQPQQPMQPVQPQQPAAQPQPAFATAQQPQQPVAQQPVQQPAQQPVQQPAFGAQPWATATVDPAQQAAQNAAGGAQQAASAPQEPPHPAQQAPAPWQETAEQPAVVANQPWANPAQ